MQDSLRRLSPSDVADLSSATAAINWHVRFLFSEYNTNCQKQLNYGWFYFYNETHQIPIFLSPIHSL